MSLRFQGFLRVCPINSNDGHYILRLFEGGT